MSSDLAGFFFSFISKYFIILFYFLFQFFFWGNQIKNSQSEYNQMINYLEINEKKKPARSEDVAGSSGSAQSLWSAGWLLADVNERHLHGQSLATDRAAKPLRCWSTQKLQKVSDRRANFGKHVVSPFDWIVGLL